ncbi:long-chain-fatty-acid--CoA ligase [Sinomonas cyclohexanicum]|uniref:Long-chain-fatty-acid--CoA ligase n=1 Tax=Sinomonas cyclohexanicum TaxID=322009 RepID=A0ABN6FHN6_SINCY|nr:AMP-binding protein [Corynebacterium cyclohexanicum]BCT76159.1 long-chain-fatty-acid--CoA ligase [Corynebacterium cyclohexanicum]
MPFLDRLSRWAAEKPHEPAVVCGRERLSWRQLHDKAADLASSGEPTAVLRQRNGVDFAVRWAAGVAGERECAVLDPTWPDELVAEVEGRLEERWGAAPGRRLDPASLADGSAESSFLVGLTSGTTSVPKAFSRSRRSWLRSFEVSTAAFRLSQDDQVLAPGPLSASLNLYTLSECLWAGATFHTLPAFDVGDAHAEITGRGITRLVLVPTMLRVLAERGLTGDVDASGVTAVVCSGQKLDRRTLEAVRRWAPRAVVWEYYGASELSFVAASSHEPGAQPAQVGTGVGRAFEGVELAILDDDGAPVAGGETGNICVRSDLVSDGYVWGDDGQAFTRLGGMCTVRDQGFLDGEELHVLGRTQDMINTGGHNVYPHEVEAALAMLPGVAEVVVAGVPDDVRGQRVVAGIVPSHAGLCQAQVRAALEGHLTPAKRPLQYLRLDTLPVTERGKLSRTEFQRWVLEGDRRAAPLA